MPAKGVIDLGQYGNQIARPVMTEPEADRIENVTQHTRKGLQDDFTIVRQALCTQQGADPGQQGRAVARAMVFTTQTEQISAVDRKNAAICLGQPPQ